MEQVEYPKMFRLEDRHFWFVGKRLFVQAILRGKQLPNCSNILDLGCGTGGMTQWLSQYGQVVGLEQNKTAADLAGRRGLKIIEGNIHTLPFGNEKFDLVTIFDVLYHKNVKDDVGVLKEVWRVLKPGGRLLVTDSALSFLWSSHDEAMHARKRYGLYEMTNKIRGVGFTVVRKSYLYFLLFPFVLMRRFWGKFLATGSDLEELPRWINTILTMVCGIEAWLLRSVSVPIGSSLMVYAEKNK